MQEVSERLRRTDLQLVYILMGDHHLNNQKTKNLINWRSSIKMWNKWTYKIATEEAKCKCLRVWLRSIHLVRTANIPSFTKFCVSGCKRYYFFRKLSVRINWLVLRIVFYLFSENKYLAKNVALTKAYF